MESKSVISVGGEQYNMRDSNVGDVSNLNTTAKTIVGALNELSDTEGNGTIPANTVLCTINGQVIRYLDSKTVSVGENAENATVKTFEDGSGIVFADDRGNVIMSYTEDGWNVAKMSDTLKSQLTAKPYSPLYGKNLYVYGYCANKSIAWYKLLADKYGMTLVDKTVTSDVTLNSIKTAIDATTGINPKGGYVLLLTSHHGYGASTSLADLKTDMGGYFAPISETFYGCHILVVPSWRQNNLADDVSESGFQTSQAQYVNGLKEIGACYGINVYDTYHDCPVRPWNSHFKSEYMNGNLKDLNASGNSYFLGVIENYIKRI